jgi:hypothetical protein
MLLAVRDFMLVFLGTAATSPGPDWFLWDPQHGHRERGRPHLTYIDVLKKDTSLSSVEENIRTVMLERDVWRGVVADRTKKPT